MPSRDQREMPVHVRSSLFDGVHGHVSVAEPPLAARASWGKPAGIRTRTREVGARCAPGYTRDLRNGRPGSNGPPRSCSGALPPSYERSKEPPAGVEPTPRPYGGRVLAVDTTEAKVETVGVEPTSSSFQARRLVQLSYTDEGAVPRTRGSSNTLRHSDCDARPERAVSEEPCSAVLRGRAASWRLACGISAIETN
jgi:hypothetical protein